MKKIKEIKKHFAHETRAKLSRKFFIIIIILILYLIFGIVHFGLKDGFLVMLITWSFFVLATPIPDGGIIIDLPLRYFANIKMVFSEMFVWIFAISLNTLNLLFNKGIYEKTFLLSLFKSILLNPFPYWIIVFLSALGTFFSIYFGDELYEVLSHKQRSKYKKHHMKFKMIMMITIIVFVIILYEFLLNHLGVSFK